MFSVPRDRPVNTPPANSGSIANRWSMPKCAAVSPIASGATATAKLKVKVKKSAKNGAYKLTLRLKGATGNTVKAKVIVKGAKKHSNGHHKK